MPDAPSHNTNDAPRTGVRRWAGRGVWAMVDHAFFAGANFLVMVGLVEWLTEHDFGAFTVAYATMLYIGVCHTAMLTEPMSVFGSGKYADRLPWYLGQLVRRHFMISGSGGLLMGAIGAIAWLAGMPALAEAMFCLAVAQSFQLLPWMLRPACYLESNPKPAAIAGLIYLVVLFSLLFTLSFIEQMHIHSAVLAMACASGMAAVYLLWKLQVRPRHLLSDPASADITADHWRYGRWALPGGLTRAVPEQIPYLVVPVFLGLAAAGELKALMLLAVPMVLAIWTVSTLLVPIMVRRLHTPEFKTLGWKMLALTTLPPLVVWPLWGVWGRPLLDVIYSGTHSEHAAILWLVGLIPVVVGVDSVLHARLRAAERPDKLFYGAVVAAVFLIAAGWPMMHWWGLGGVVGAVLLSYVVQCVCLWVTGRKTIAAACLPRKEQDDASPSPLGVEPPHSLQTRTEDSQTEPVVMGSLITDS